MSEAEKVFSGESRKGSGDESDNIEAGGLTGDRIVLKPDMTEHLRATVPETLKPGETYVVVNWSNDQGSHEAGVRLENDENAPVLVVRTNLFNRIGRAPH